MAGIRERMAHAARCSNLGSSDHDMRPVECVGAMGSTSRREKLGVLAVRLKYANDASVHAQLCEHLRYLIPGRMTYGVKTAIAEQAIREYIFTKCKACDGTGFIRHVRCMKCHSSTIRRYSDNDRMRAMGVDLRAAKSALYSRLVSDLLSVLNSAEKNAAGDTNHSLKCLEGTAV